MRRYTPLRVGVAIVGAGVICTDTSLNIANQWTQTGSLLDPTVVATLSVAVATTIGAFAATEAMRSKGAMEKAIGCIMLLGVMVGGAFTFSQSIERYTTQRQAYLGELAKIEQAKRVETSPYAVRILEVQGEIDRLGLRSQVKSECVDDIIMADGRLLKNVRYNPDVHDARWFPRCDAAYRTLARLDNQIKSFQAMMMDVTRVEYWEVDKAAESLALGLPLSQEVISIYMPWLLPTALLLFGFTLFAWGMSGERVEVEFNLALAGDAALVDKTERYAKAYREQNGVWPTKADCSAIAGLSPQRCETILKRLKSRKRKSK